CKDGDLVRLGPGDPAIIDELPSGRLYKDGAILEDSKSRAVVERRRMAFAGCVFVAIAMTDKGELADDPEIDLVGIPEKNMAGEELDDIVFDAVVSTVETLPRARRRDPDALAESVLDLYAGVGLFARFLADEVGAKGSVVGVESDKIAAGHAKNNLGRSGKIVRDRVDRWLKSSAPDRVDLVVLDPPRAGAKSAVVAGIAKMRPRAVSYVACDPAALARDVAYFAEHGYILKELRCLDMFPMTHHVECVALFTPNNVS
ncbi:MAG TPA: hypothetical protein VN108_09995, partial [Marmoricola sp.]|nr:hypothetical protein [Marmoricola sp.]